jgi:hypothetical protein
MDDYIYLTIILNINNIITKLIIGGYMQTKHFIQEKVVCPDVRLNFCISHLKKTKTVDVKNLLTTSVVSKGLHSMTKDKIEDFICTSALTAHI